MFSPSETVLINVRHNRKTTIAKHFGTFLKQLSILPEGSIFRETSGAKLMSDGIAGLKKILAEVKSAKGGVVFCDEAYQLVTDREGKKVLDFILPLAEKLDSEFGPLVWVFAGYKKEMEKLFEYNSGLRSRFPHNFVFQDYNDDELREIFEDMMKYQPARPLVNVGGSNDNTQTGKAKADPTPRCRSFSVGAKRNDRFGRTWTYHQNSGWTDELGNRTLDPGNLGFSGSELVDPSGTFWKEDGGTWFNLTSGVSQMHYPGDAAPLSSQSRQSRSTPFHCNDAKDLTIAMRGLGRSRCEKGFGNARAVRILFEKVRDRQAQRLTLEREIGRDPDRFEFSRTDLLGPDVTPDSLKQSDAWKKLEEMEGPLPVKESVEQLFKLVLNNVKRERNGQPLFEVVLNRLFLGAHSIYPLRIGLVVFVP